ncbi:hypothetical protein ABBQ38_011941 [Trebouxia sp. C0009 RCD-2024]
MHQNNTYSLAWLGTKLVITGIVMTASYNLLDNGAGVQRAPTIMIGRGRVQGPENLEPQPCIQDEECAQNMLSCAEERLWSCLQQMATSLHFEKECSRHAVRPLDSSS